MTWNPADKAQNVTLSPDRLSAFVTNASGSANDCVRATVGHKTGKYYWEVEVISRGTMSFCGVGLGSGSFMLEDAPSYEEGGCQYFVDGEIKCHGSPAVMGAQLKPGDVVGIALDLDNRRAHFRWNGHWKTGDPGTTGTGLEIDGLASRTIYPAVNLSTGDKMTARFGGGGIALTSSPPPGYAPGWIP